MITDKSKISTKERKLRTLLALNAGNPGLYTDDGELSDGTVHPAIDFLRDDPDTIEAKLLVRGKDNIDAQYAGRQTIIDYTNWKGERKLRRIRPVHMWYGSTEFHKEEQWLITAVDLEDGDKEKDFALKDIHMFSGTIQFLTVSREKGEAR